MTMQKNAQVKIFELEMWFPAFSFSESIEFCLKLKGYLQGILLSTIPSQEENNANHGSKASH